jgi:CTP:molybdopterin cytidylyltransferase MocA
MQNLSNTEMNQSTPDLPDLLRLGCIILAAGPSSRLGSPKQLLIIDGKALIIRTIESALESGAWPVVVVLGSNQDAIRPILAKQPVIIIENASWPEGMASSIRCGVAALTQFSRMLNTALILVCDQPALSGLVLKQLIKAHNPTDAGITAAHYLNRNAVPALFTKSYFSTLTSLTGEHGARQLLNEAGEKITSVELPELALDIDTLSDYEKIVSKF